MSALRCACACVLLLALCGSCDACEDPSPVLATLVEMDGQGVQRDHASELAQWQRAAIDARFVAGDGVRTDAASSAVLELAGGGTLRVRPGTTVRFVVEGATQDERAIDVQVGEALLISGQAELRVRTHVGFAVLAAGTRLRLSRNGEALDYDVEVGQATLRDRSGQSAALQAGESMTVAIGAATLRKRPVALTEPKPAAAEAPVVQTVEPVVVILAQVRSRGVQARDAHPEAAWRALVPGELALSPGMGLRLPARALVELERGQDRVRLHGAGEFVIGSDGAMVEAKQGAMDVSARAQHVELIVPGGRIVALAQQAGSSARVQVGATSGRVLVELGTVQFTGGGVERSLQQGEQHRFSVALESPADADVAAGPSYASFHVRAGESFVVHAPEVPVAIAFDASHECSGEVVIELVSGKQRGQGVGRGNLSLLAGKHAYTARCVEGAAGARRASSVVARGTAHVLLDAGTRKLPARAPTSQVEADGRTYSVYYQNQLPDIRVRWPNAPSAAQYTLDVDGAVRTVPQPEYVLRSGTLRDGVHRLAFSAGGRRSRSTTVEVSFDNTAAAASLSSPVNRAFAPGVTVEIAGVLLPAWKVSVDGASISMEGTGRFVGKLVTSAERPDFAVRLAHSRLGTHYYVRQAAGSR